jgi:hypothetical protein
LQFFGSNKRPAAPIANMGRKKNPANICKGLVPQPHRKQKLISMYDTYCIIGPNAMYIMGIVFLLEIAALGNLGKCSIG